MKAIFEFEMPKNCLKCPLSYSMEWGITHVIKCAALGRVIEHRLKYRRVTDCPLKIIEAGEVTLFRHKVLLTKMEAKELLEALETALWGLCIHKG